MVSGSLRNLKGIGEKTEKLFEKVGVGDLNQLLHYYPREYDLYEPAIGLSELRPGQKNAVQVKLTAAPTLRGSGRQSVALLQLREGEQTLQVIWFHSPHLRATLKRGTSWVFRGPVIEQKGRWTMEHPEIYSLQAYEAMQKRMQPIYALTAGLRNKLVCKSVQQVLELADGEPELLPEDLRKRLDLPDVAAALGQIHFPESAEGLRQGRRRLVFDEFFFFLLAMQLLKAGAGEEPNAFPMPRTELSGKLLSALPYELTGGQKEIWEQIRRDLQGSRPTNRLIQGDVGSGKTILAFLAMITAFENGRQSLIMVPTEVLALQHYESLCSLLKSSGIEGAEPVLLRGSCTAAEKREAYRRIAAGECRMIVGTHALIQEKLVYEDLGLVITDEQHRFGVKQRGILTEKSHGTPHVLVMSATPIPRTLALILYGDLDVSVLKDMPAMRKPIKSCVVDQKYREASYRFIEGEISRGHQVYVICPMVSENEELDCENVTDTCKKLKERFKGSAVVEMLHGQMKGREKEDIMERFSRGEIQILVSTTVVEVGVNVPNATGMIIENAERFGLAQLHQLRGRVGRGDAQSYCVFMKGKDAGEKADRLEILGKSNDGFLIAEEDLKQRGPGDFFGVRQSGGPDFKLADIYADAEVLGEASEAVRDLLEEDPFLAAPEHRCLLAEAERIAGQKIVL